MFSYFRPQIDFDQIHVKTLDFLFAPAAVYFAQDMLDFGRVLKSRQRPLLPSSQFAAERPAAPITFDQSIAS